MHFSVAPKNQLNSGFSLTELVIIGAIISIIAAIAIPNFSSWLQTRRANNAIAVLEGALKEAQRSAIRTNTTCTITLTPGTNPRIVASPPICLPMGERIGLNADIRLGEDVTLRTDVTTASVNNTIVFGFQGRTNSRSSTPPFNPSDPPGAATIVVASPQVPSSQRCLVMGPGLGIMRVGTYLASDTTGTFANNCIPRTGLLYD